MAERRGEDRLRWWAGEEERAGFADAARRLKWRRKGQPPASSQAATPVAGIRKPKNREAIRPQLYDLSHPSRLVFSFTANAWSVQLRQPIYLLDLGISDADTRVDACSALDTILGGCGGMVMDVAFAAKPCLYFWSSQLEGKVPHCTACMCWPSAAWMRDRPGETI